MSKDTKTERARWYCPTHQITTPYGQFCTACTNEGYTIISEDALKREPGADNALPADSKVRKTYPIGTGLVDYFPDALAEVAHISFLGNEKHNPGQPLHWSRDKSADHADCLMRHFVDRGKLDSEGVRHSAQLAWRALALLQLELEAAKEKSHVR